MKDLSNRAAPGIAVLAALALLAGCRGAGDETARATRETGQPRARDAGAPAPVRVTVREIVPTSFTERLAVAATLEAWHEVTLSAEFGGTVRRVLFDKGDAIRRGQELARVGDDLAQAQLAQAEADLMAAEANFTKISRLFERRAVPKQDLVAATSQRDRARAVVDEMKARVERAVIRSPIDGIALDRPLEPGEVVPPGTPIVTIQSIAKLKAVVSVPDTEAAWLVTGRPAVLRFDAYPERTFPATVSFVAPAADAETRTFRIELALRNDDRALRPGMVGRALLDRRRITGALVVPFDAVLPRADGSVVFVVDDACRARLRPVEIGGIEGSQALVDDGLTPGDRVVVAGQADLVDGQPVLTETCR